MRTLSVRGLTEGAILAALVALFALASRYLPLIGIASALVCPLPLTMLVIRHGTLVGLLAAVVAAAIGAMISEPLTGVTILITFAPLGIALGIGIRRRLPASTVVLISTAVVTLSLLVNVLGTLLLAGVNPYTLMIEGMQRGQDTAVRLYSRLGMDRQQIEQVTGPMRQFIDLLPRLIPLLIVVGGVSTAYINYQVGRLVLRKFGQDLPALPPMFMWRVPSPFLWVLPLGLLLVVWGRTRYPALETAGLNLSILAQMVFSLQGLFVGWVLLERFSMSRWLRWLIIAFAFTNPFLGLLAFFLGLADTAFDLRRRWHPSTTPQAPEETLRRPGALRRPP